MNNVSNFPATVLALLSLFVISGLLCPWFVGLSVISGLLYVSVEPVVVEQHSVVFSLL